MSFLLRTTLRSSQFIACRACARRWALSSPRWSSTEASPPPLIARMKGDLKAAMKAKDAPRLNVLRAIITDYNNASKTSSPILNDMQVLGLLRKRKSSSEEAEKEALGLKRDDIAAKQRSEISVLDEYAGSIQLMSEDNIKTAVQSAIDQLRSAGTDTKAGQVLKEIFKPSGVLDGKPVDKSQVAKLVNSLLTTKS